MGGVNQGGIPFTKGPFLCGGPIRDLDRTLKGQLGGWSIIAGDGNVGNQTVFLTALLETEFRKKSATLLSMFGAW